MSVKLPSGQQMIVSMDRYEWREWKVGDWAADDPALPGRMPSHDNFRLCRTLLTGVYSYTFLLNALH